METEALTAVRLAMADAEVIYYPNIIPPDVATDLHDWLIGNVAWRQDYMAKGRKPPLPRLTAWYGEKAFKYSGILNGQAPVPDPLQSLKHIVEAQTEAQFDGVLCIRYRNGNDKMGWHADSETEHGADPIIAAVSLGEEREFQFRRINDHQIREFIILGHGSLLVMRGPTQRNWQHCLPKTTKRNGERINLSFRQIVVDR